MVKTEEKQIGENTYRVTQLGAKRGRELLIRMFKIGGPVIGELVRGFDDKKITKASGIPSGETFNIGDIPLEAVASALEELATRISDAEFSYLCDTLAERTELVLEGGDRVIKLSGVFDLHFAGRYGELFRWLAFSLLVNYRDFFGDSTGGALLAGLMGKRAKPAPASR